MEEQLNKLIIWMAKRALSVLEFREECARVEELKQAQRLEALAQKARQDAEKEKPEGLKMATLLSGSKLWRFGLIYWPWKTGRLAASD